MRTILVIGGTGFIGSRIVAQLAASGTDCIIVPTRRLSRAKHLQVMPTVRLLEENVHDDAALDRLMAGADAVINLVGVLHSKRGAEGSAYGPDFARAYVELPRRIVAACKRHQVSRLLHMSALGADRNGPSMYQRSKADGEAAVFAEPSIAVTVFRPSVVFGPGDSFLNMFASLQRIFPLMPLGGADARFQPVYVGDVAQAFCNALERRATFGKVYELAGPTVYTLRELVQIAGAMSGHRRPVIALPPALARLQATVLEFMPGGPVMSRDNLDSMQVDNVASGPIAPELGVEPTPLEVVAPTYLAQRDRRSRFDDLRERARRR